MSITCKLPNQVHLLSVWVMPTKLGFGWRPVKSEWCKQINRNEVYTSACGEQLSSVSDTLSYQDCYLDERKTTMARQKNATLRHVSLFTRPSLFPHDVISSYL